MVGATLTDPTGQTYELLERLGEGSFGEVFLARKGALGKRVAVKLLKVQVPLNSEAKLRDEARVVAALNHPGILAVDDLVRLGERLGLVTEFIEGEDLSGCLAGEGRMPTSTVVEVAGKVAWALHAAWKQGQVVHRDVKPANIRVGVHGTVKLLDFGIARSELMDREASDTRGILGTLRYLAPERFHLGARPKPSSDVFSLGCVLYLGVTGSPFYGDLDFEEIAGLSLAREDWERLLEQNLASVQPQTLVPLLRGLLAYRAEERWSAAQAGEACEAVVARWSGHVTLERWCRERWPDAAPSAPGLSGGEAPTWSSLAPSTRFERNLPAREPSEVSSPDEPSAPGQDPPRQDAPIVEPGQDEPSAEPLTGPRRWRGGLVLAALALPLGLALACAATATGWALWLAEAPVGAGPLAAPSEPPPSAPEPHGSLTLAGPREGLTVIANGERLDETPISRRRLPVGTYRIEVPGYRCAEAIVREGEDARVDCSEVSPPRRPPSGERASPRGAQPQSAASAGAPSVAGALDKEVISEVVGRHMGSIQRCYDQARALQPTLGGRVVIAFTVASDGTVPAARVDSTTLNDESLEGCLAARFLDMRFPPHAGGESPTVRIPLVFQPQP